MPSVTVIRGPRGSGKSAVVEAWRESGRLPADQVVIIAPPHNRGQRQGYWAAAEESLARSTSPTVIVLDLPERLDDTALEERVVDLLDQPGRRISVIILTRLSFAFPTLSRPPGGYQVITPNQLQFTAEETGLWLRTFGHRLSTRDIDTVCELTGGHAALTAVAASVARLFAEDLSIGPKLFASTLTRAIDDYVRDASARDPELADFDLARLSIAHELDNSSAPIVGGDLDLPQLEWCGIATRGLGPGGDSYRIPDGVRDSLLRMACQDTPEVVRSTSATLCTVQLTRRQPLRALDYARLSEDWTRVAEIIESHWLTLMAVPQQSTRDALLALPPQIVDRNPLLGAWRSLSVQAARTRPTTAEHEFHESGPAQPGSLERELAPETLRSMQFRMSGRFRDAAALSARLSTLADREAAEHPPARDGLPFLHLQWGINHLLHGNFDECADAFLKAVSGTLAEGFDFVRRDASGKLALLYAVHGDPTRAGEWVSTSEQFDLPPDGMSSITALGQLTARALTALDRMDLDSAREALDAIGTVSDQEELWSFASYARSQYALMTGNAESGLSELWHEKSVYRRWLTSDALATQLLAAAEADLLCALGRGSEARTIASTPGTFAGLTTVRARIELLTGNPQGALGECTQLPSNQNRGLRAPIEIALIAAAAYTELGDTAAAEKNVRHARTLSSRTGVVRPFAMMSSRSAASSAHLREAPTDLPPATRPVFPDAIDHVDLTTREVAVLRELETGAKNIEIATRLFVSVNTVKSQSQSLYRKLGARSRVEAVTTARHLGLL
ncbi:LuxR C-terminal-related transcriptional regulator [Rhodococcus sp. ABRD24]|uniref:LuxR C-terminal-related transcriptional regulator n=1 Tax=Rhodococcus sp. ABRD24 TaxID=2507582 RepID=UPI001A955C8A|nr:LuxR C-terminal-related transcriptional regulator [Rhodococcus sp. ABRD24]